MPRPGPRRLNTAVRLSEETTTSLDAMASQRGIKRSDVIREAIDAHLSKRTTNVVDASPEVPVGLARHLLQRLGDKALSDLPEKTDRRAVRNWLFDLAKDISVLDGKLWYL